MVAQSIPLVCQDWANTKAASVSSLRTESVKRTFWPAISNRHMIAAAAEGLVLVLHDTTEFSYQRKKSERSASPRA
jgi:2-methylisocitrate lyase-like PEP mutase family enzyme